jgi:hypothetical protein
MAVTRKCKHHGEVEFKPNGINKKTGKLQYRCSICKKRWNNKSYQYNTDYHKNRQKEFKKKRKKQWIEYLESMIVLECQECGYNKCFAALDFHHVDNNKKENSISKIICLNSFTDKNKKILIEEIRKCVILCSNCHRETHFGDRIIQENRLIWR